MTKKTLAYCATLLAAGTINASPITLDHYDAIKQELLNGNTVKAIVDFGKCVLIEGDSKSKGLRNIIGLRIDNFMIADRTSAITTSHSFLNTLDKKNPYGLKGYRRGDITIMPNQDVMIDTEVLALPDYKTLAPIKLLCKVANGATFYKAI